MVLKMQFGPWYLLLGKRIAPLACRGVEKSVIHLSNIINNIIDKSNHPRHGITPFSLCTTILQVIIAHYRTISGLWEQGPIRTMASTVKNKYGVSPKDFYLSFGGLFTIC